MKFKYEFLSLTIYHSELPLFLITTLSFQIPLYKKIVNFNLCFHRIKNVKDLGFKRIIVGACDSFLLQSFYKCFLFDNKRGNFFQL